MMSNVRKDVRRVDDLNFGCSVFARFFSVWKSGEIAA